MASNQTKSRNHPKKKINLILYAYMVLILLILTTVATYAWFSLSANPRVSNLSFYVNSVHGMEISLYPDRDWSQHISSEELFPDKYVLRPATYSQKTDSFYGMSFRYDGKVRDEWFPLNEQVNANSTTNNNYYCIGTFYAHTDTNTRVSLAPALSLNDNLERAGTYLMGAPGWNAETIHHEDLGQGAQNAIRVAIKVIRLDSEYNPTGEESFFIYEPNANSHNTGVSGYVPTPSIDGTPTLIDQDKIITQSVSLWGEVTPVERGALKYYMGSFDGSTELFTMKADEVVKIQIIIWLEGQDVDCTNMIADASIIANLQFNAVTEGGGGLVPIDSDAE